MIVVTARRDDSDFDATLLDCSDHLLSSAVVGEEIRRGYMNALVCRGEQSLKEHAGSSCSACRRRAVDYHRISCAISLANRKVVGAGQQLARRFEPVFRKG